MTSNSPTKQPKKDNRGCNHDILSEETTLQPILRPLSDSKKEGPTTYCEVCDERFDIRFEDNRTRSEYARDALMAALPKDNWSNLGMNESYRRGLDDMVEWMDGTNPTRYTTKESEQRAVNGDNSL